MLRGKSLSHVKQGPGRIYSFNHVLGYYNDLTEKVTKDVGNYSSVEAFRYCVNGKTFFAPIELFQYGLGAYDLFLLKRDEKLMLAKFRAQVDWALANQAENGSWDAFSWHLPAAPFSSMAQGEGASLLLRAYVQFGDKRYLYAARKALLFMLTPLSQGGTAEYRDGDLFLYEFTNHPYVFNGWIFSIFGLIDYSLISDDSLINDCLNKTLRTLAKVSGKMDNGYWSMYRNDKTIASPFYHDLHIALLDVLYEYSKEPIFASLSYRFKQYKNKSRNRRKAFIKKAFQKIFSKED